MNPVVCFINKPCAWKVPVERCKETAVVTRDEVLYITEQLVFRFSCPVGVLAQECGNFAVGIITDKLIIAASFLHIDIYIYMAIPETLHSIKRAGYSQLLFGNGNNCFSISKTDGLESSRIEDRKRIADARLYAFEVRMNHLSWASSDPAKIERSPVKRQRQRGKTELWILQTENQIVLSAENAKDSPGQWFCINLDQTQRIRIRFQCPPVYDPFIDTGDQ